MIVNPTTSLEKKELFLETLLNQTDKISKISPNSVISGIAYGVSRLAQKCEKDISIHLSYLFPDYADGEALDNIASMYGQPPRFGASNSSVYVRIVGAPNTFYDKNVCIFKASKEDIQFNLTENVTMNSLGYTYAKLVSNKQGSITNVDAQAIYTINNQPNGHRFCINETQAVGGRDIESDDLFRNRIKDNINRVATGSMALLEQRAILINPNVLKIFNYGMNQYGKYRIAVATQNGIDLTVDQLSAIANGIAPFLSLSDSSVFGYTTMPIELENVHYKLFDVSTRVKLNSGVAVNDIVNDIQIRINQEFNFKFWQYGSKVEWDNILDIVKNTDGIKYVYDDFFYPKVDIPVQRFELPRLRGFLLLDEKGAIIKDNTSTGQNMPLYYPNEADFNIQQILL